MDSVNTRTGWWVESGLWVLASLAGWAAGLALGALFVEIGSRVFGLNADRALAYAVLLAVGLAVGDTQSAVLRRHLPGAWRWIPVTLAGYLLAMGITAAAGSARIGSDLMSNAIILGLIGAAIGVPQWLLLRRTFGGAGLWVLASAAGFLAFLWLVAHPVGSEWEFIAAGAILGALAAIPPGLVLARMVSRPRPAIERKEHLP
jgi:hypothetical protein